MCDNDKVWVCTLKDHGYIFSNISEQDIDDLHWIAIEIFDRIEDIKKDQLPTSVEKFYKKYNVSTIEYVDKNWEQYLRELAKEHDIEIDDDYFVIKINNEKYELFKGSWANALQTCRELKLLNGNNDECSILHGPMSKKGALDSLSVYRAVVLKHVDINTYWIICKDEKYELYYGSLNNIENMKKHGYEIWKDTPFTEDGANSELSRLNMKS